MVLNTGYEVILAGVGGACIAQILKVLIYFLTHKKFNFKILSTTGGMPSAHSSGVIALTTSVGIIRGYDSLLFAVSLGYAVITMYDAAGIRRAAGKTAATLNRFIKEIQENGQKIEPYETLKELLGHTPVEVFCGAILGFVFAYSCHTLLALLAV